ncbi:uncharacterized protein LOC124411865 [Diprion similis]|uniref:uncharacterized protein LOC124411865 n=1 Tax=Diprion similis TaxID=362088 RepID=UPI001EF765FA|nr:uncharacterized protein LOC124411865 [Diprion similis]
MVLTTKFYTTTTITTTSRSETITSTNTASTISTVPNETAPIINRAAETVEDPTSPPTTFVLHATPIGTTTAEPEREVSKPTNDTATIQQLMDQNRRLLEYITRLQRNQTSTPDKNLYSSANFSPYTAVMF